MYDIGTGKGKPSNEERSEHTTRKEAKGLTKDEIKVDCEDSEAKKKLLEAIEAALDSGSLEKITLVIKPKQKPKQQ